MNLLRQPVRRVLQRGYSAFTSVQLEPVTEELARGVTGGQRTALARAITLSTSAIASSYTVLDVRTQIK